VSLFLTLAALPPGSPVVLAIFSPPSVFPFFPFSVAGKETNTYSHHLTPLSSSLRLTVEVLSFSSACPPPPLPAPFPPTSTPSPRRTTTTRSTALHPPLSFTGLWRPPYPFLIVRGKAAPPKPLGIYGGNSLVLVLESIYISPYSSASPLQRRKCLCPEDSLLSSSCLRYSIFPLT